MSKESDRPNQQRQATTTAPSVEKTAYLDVDPKGHILTLSDVDGYIFRRDTEAVNLMELDIFAQSLEQEIQEAINAANLTMGARATRLTLPATEKFPSLHTYILPHQTDCVRVIVFATLCPKSSINPKISQKQRPHLTPREKSVLQLIVTGLKRDMIAHKLNISVPTLDMHSRNLRQKLSARTSSEAVAIAAKMGLIEL